MSTSAARAQHAELRRLARFCVVGALNTALTLATFSVLVAFAVPAALASAVGFGVGALNGYELNARWTFAGARRDRTVVARYVGVQLGGAALSAAGVAAGRGAGLAQLSAEFVILPVVTLSTYLLGRRFVFSR